jgi:LacI family transcriptional regulator
MAVSVKDVAAAAQVSVGTVSNVLNRPEKVPGATVARVQEAIDRLGFVRNDAARQLRAGRSRAIGMVVLDLRNPFFADVARGAQERAAEHGLSVLVADSDEEPGRERSALALFEQQRVAGVLVTPVAEDVPLLLRMRERGVPVVLVDRESHEEALPSVAVDDVEGGRLAADHLLSIGRRRLAFVGGPASLRQVADRFEGARRAVAEAPGASLATIGTTALTVAEGRSAAERIARTEASERPDAIFAANDLVAMGLLQGLVMSGDVRVPDDVALIGYDDIDFAAAAVVPLSSVRQPAALIGATAVELLLRAPVERAERVLYRPELVVRASTARRSAASG